MRNAKYPCYYDQDGVSVALYLEEDVVIGKSANGKPYLVGKVIVEGIKVSKREYLRIAKNLYGKR